MARLIIIAVIAGVIAIAVASALAGGMSSTSGPGKTKDTTMPAPLQTVAYVLLIVLMFGITTGWIGGL